MWEGWTVEVSVINHPLVDHKLTLLRKKTTEQPVFRKLVDELVTLLAYEATRGVRVDEIEIETPVAQTIGTRLAQPAPLVVPIHAIIVRRVPFGGNLQLPVLEGQLQVLLADAR